MITIPLNFIIRMTVIGYTHNCRGIESPNIITEGGRARCLTIVSFNCLRDCDVKIKILIRYRLALCIGVQFIFYNDFPACADAAYIYDYIAF